MARSIDQAKRTEAFRLWCRTRDLAGIGVELDISLPTLRKWKLEDQWEAKLKDLGAAFAQEALTLQRMHESLVFRDLWGDIKKCEVLEAKVAEAVLIEGVRPKTWGEVIQTMKFVRDVKASIHERLGAGVRGNAPPEAAGADKMPLTEEDREKLSSMMKLVNKETTPPPPSMIGTKATPAVAPEDLPPEAVSEVPQ